MSRSEYDDTLDHFEEEAPVQRRGRKEHHPKHGARRHNSQELRGRALYGVGYIPIEKTPAGKVWVLRAFEEQPGKPSQDYQNALTEGYEFVSAEAFPELVMKHRVGESIPDAIHRGCNVLMEMDEDLYLEREEISNEDSADEYFNILGRMDKQVGSFEGFGARTMGRDIGRGGGRF